MGRLAKLWGKLRVSGLDPRAVGMFRIVVGLNLIYNILRYRLFYVPGFHAGELILPEYVVHRMYGDYFSILSYLQTERLVTGFFLATLVLAVLYTIGFYPRVVGILCLFCVWSILHRNPFTAHGVESYLDVCLFWGTFLPLGAAFSLFPGSAPPGKSEIRGWVAWGILFQIALIYFTGAVTKSGEMWREGIALYAATDDRTHAWLLSGVLARYPALCTALNYGAIATEGAIPLLIFAPLANRMLRLGAAVLILLLHLGIGLSLNVGPFYLVAIAFVVLLLPSFVWDRLGLRADSLPWRVRRPLPAFRLSPALLRVARVTLGVVVAFMMLFILQKNLQKWRKESYLSDWIRATPVLESIAKLDTPAIGLSGTFRQPWWLFAPDPHHEMGTIIIAGITEDQRFIDLLTGEPLLEPNHETQQLQLVADPWNAFSGTRFVFSFYVRHYYQSLPDEVYRNWARYEFRRFRKHDSLRLQEVAVMLYSNDTTLVDGELRRSNEALVLGSYIPTTGE